MSPYRQPDAPKDPEPESKLRWVLLWLPRMLCIWFLRRCPYCWTKLWRRKHIVNPVRMEGADIVFCPQAHYAYQYTIYFAGAYSKERWWHPVPDELRRQIAKGVLESSYPQPIQCPPA
jgi:hypothetical protein